VSPGSEVSDDPTTYLLDGCGHFLSSAKKNVNNISLNTPPFGACNSLRVRIAGTNRRLHFRT